MLRFIATRAGIRSVDHHVPRQANVTDALVDAFKKVKISESNSSNAEQVRRDVTQHRQPTLQFLSTTTMQRRFLHFTASNFSSRSKQQQHQHHLNARGFIKGEILDQRRSFLSNHGMLKDKMLYDGRTVYANYHLFKLMQEDAQGKTNLERMQNGNCPLGLDGEDYIVIHHFSQTHSGDWVVLTNEFHCTYHQELHSFCTPIDRVDVRKFQREKKAFWKCQAEKLSHELEIEDVLEEEHRVVFRRQ